MPFKESYGLISALAILAMLSACGGEDSNKPEIKPDTTPDAFTFEGIDNLSPNTFHLTRSITITGVDEAINLSVDGCEYSLNESSEYLNLDTQVKTGDILKFRILTSSERNTESICKITAGNYTTTVSVRTARLLAQVEFYYEFTDDLTITPTIDRLFFHDSLGKDLREVPSPKSNILELNGSEPQSFSAWFEYQDEGTKRNTIITVYNLSKDEGFGIPLTYNEYTGQGCRTVNLDIDYETIESMTGTDIASHEVIEMISDKLCSWYIYTGSSQMKLNNASPAKDKDLLAVVKDHNRNYTAYEYFNSEDYKDGDTLSMSASIKTDFLKMSVDSSLEENSLFQIYAIPIDEELPIYTAGVYEFLETSNDSRAVLNVIETADVRYLIHRFIYSDERSYAAWGPYIEELPPSQSIGPGDYLLNQLSSTWDKESSSLNLSWTGNEAHPVDWIEVELKARTKNKEEITWIIASNVNSSFANPDTGVQLLIPNLGAQFEGIPEIQDLEGIHIHAKSGTYSGEEGYRYESFRNYEVACTSGAPCKLLDYNKP